MDGNEAKRLQKVMSDSEQMMQDIIENRREQLDEFLLSDSPYKSAQAYISFALAHHFALKGISHG